jgi:DNA-binding LacI/PurR family transcriptional regulator
VARPTILDVAKKAGVGVGTVSRVLNNSPRVSPTTRQKVLEAIQELGFKPSAVARQLPRKTQLRNIGVITQPFVSYYSFVERLRGVQQVLWQDDPDYELVLYNISSGRSYNDRLQSIARSGAVEGLLIIDLDLNDDQIELLNGANIPVVGLNQFQDRAWPCIGCDNLVGATLATNYLIELGYRRIAYVGDEFIDEYGFYTSAERYEGYKNALAAADIPLDESLVWLGRPYGFETARVLTANLLRQANQPDAIFAMSDIQALGCIAAIKTAGLRIPEDIAVIGYDNLETSFHTGLTTVNQNLELSGRLGIDYLLKLVTHRDPGPPPAMPPLEVIPRQTTRDPGRTE